MSNPFQNVIRNGVLSLSYLKKISYPLFKYYINNRSMLKRRFKQDGIDVLNDLHTKNTYTNIKLFLRFHYGDTVNITVLRAKDKTVYNYISLMGKPYEVIEEMGFHIEYSPSKRSMEYIIAELNRISDDEGFIYKINDTTLYSKLQSRARKNNNSVKEYVKSLGYTYGININKILEYRKQGYSITKIAELLSISHTTVSRTLRKVGDSKQEE